MINNMIEIYLKEDSHVTLLYFGMVEEYAVESLWKIVFLAFPEQ
jgi:hypothetical protein